MTAPRTIAGIGAALDRRYRAAFVEEIRRVDLLDPLAVRSIVDRYRQSIADGRAPAPPPAPPSPPDATDGPSGFVESLRVLRLWSAATPVPSKPGGATPSGTS